MVKQGTYLNPLATMQTRIGQGYNLGPSPTNSHRRMDFSMLFKAWCLVFKWRMGAVGHPTCKAGPDMRTYVLFQRPSECSKTGQQQEQDQDHE